MPKTKTEVMVVDAEMLETMRVPIAFADEDYPVTLAEAKKHLAKVAEANEGKTVAFVRILDTKKIVEQRKFRFE